MRTSPGSTGRFVDTPLKWVGVVTVLLCLLLLLNQASKVFAEIRDRQRQVGELQAMADRQQRAGDFRDAWTSLDRAAATAGRRAAISPGSRARRTPSARPSARRRKTWPWRGSNARRRRAARASRTRSIRCSPPWRAAPRRRPAGARPICWRTSDGRSSSSRATAAPTRAIRSRSIVRPSRRIPRTPTRTRTGDTGSPGSAGRSTRPRRTSTRRWRRAASGRTCAACSWRRCSSPGPAASQAAYLAAVADMVRNQEPVEPGVRNTVFALFARACDDAARFDAARRRGAAGVADRGHPRPVLRRGLRSRPANRCATPAWRACRQAGAAVAAAPPALLR